MTHEDYVSFEQAKALKELGFDWECNHYYHIEDEERIAFYSYYGNHNGRSKKLVSASTLAHAQKWLREVKGKIIIPCVMHLGNIMKYDFYIADEPIDLFDYSDGFNSYEQALSAGIDRALVYLKEQDNGER